MKAVFLVLFSGLRLSLAGNFIKPPKAVLPEEDFFLKQQQVFILFYQTLQETNIPEIERFSQEFQRTFENNEDKFINVGAVENFRRIYKRGKLPKGEIFSVFYDQMRKEAIALFDLFYYAKDFANFYLAAAWARQHINEGMFLYALTLAMLHRKDCRRMFLPAPYEIHPHYFVDSFVMNKMYQIQMQTGIENSTLAEYNGVIYANKSYTFYANYTGSHNSSNPEQMTSYFTEDVGLNSYYFYFHADYPFWMDNDEYGLNKDRRGETYYYFHQQLLARYYWERLTNGLGEIPTLNWDKPVETGYNPFLKYSNGRSFPMRPNHFVINSDRNTSNIDFVKDFDALIRSIIVRGQYSSTEGIIHNLRTEQGIEYLANLIRNNPESIGEKKFEHHKKYYEIIARTLLGGSVKPINEYYSSPSVLENFMNSPRDPTFWQLSKHLVHYFLLLKRYMTPYTTDDLNYPGVKVETVKVDKLETYFDYYDWDSNNAIYFSKKQLIDSDNTCSFFIRQPRLNHLAFSVAINITSEKNVDSVVRIFMAPKCNSDGNSMGYDDNKYNFVEIDSFLYKLTVGENTISRSSEEFFHVIGDPIPGHKLYKQLDAANHPQNYDEAMFQLLNGFPHRLLLPKGTKDGFPSQLFVIVSSHRKSTVTYGTKARYLDARAFGYPFDRPIDDTSFYQPNMFTEDVLIYHSGSDFVHEYGSHRSDKD